MANYLCQNRYGTYYFRCVIPFAYRKYFKNKREIRYSLKTDSKKVALPKSRLYRVWLDRTFEDLATMHDDEEVIRTGLMTHWGMFGDKTEIDHGDDKDKEFEHVEKLKDKDFDRAIKLGLKPEEIIKLQAATKTNTQASISSEINKTSPTWDEFSKQFLSRKLAAEHIRQGTMDEYQTSYKRFSDFARGDRSLIEFDVEQLSDFYDSMSGLSINTRNKHLERITSVFNWAVVNKKINFNPVDGVMKLKDDTRDKDKRDMFEMEDLKMIFESDFYIKNLWRKRPLKVRIPYTFWMFPLAALTGARLAELALIETANIYVDAEIPYLDLQNEYDPETGELIDRKLKNDNSIRQVPISDTLIEMGFLDFVRASRKKYLFPDILEKDTTSDAAQKVLGARLKKLDVWVKNRKSFHSFRHSFANIAVDNGVDEVALGTVTGHLLKTKLELVPELKNTYLKDGNTVELVKLLKREVIDKLKYDVDFSGVKWPTLRITLRIDGLWNLFLQSLKIIS